MNLKHEIPAYRPRSRPRAGQAGEFRKRMEGKLRIFSISALAFGSVVWSELSISILLKMCYEGKTIFRRFFE